MIIIRDWVAAIPPEEKSIAYVGEGQTVSRQFLLTGEGWEAYRDFGFHLDMAFDLSTVTRRESFLRETTQQMQNENFTESGTSESSSTTTGTQTAEESGTSETTKTLSTTQSNKQETDSKTTVNEDATTNVNGDTTTVTGDTTTTVDATVQNTGSENTNDETTGTTSMESSRSNVTSQTESGETASTSTGTATTTTTKETRTVTEVEVNCTATTDVASLDKEVTEDGILLTWLVLPQQTQLPGRLRATLRGMGAAGEVKKSAIMVFEVEPAVLATPAAEVPVSEFRQMEQRMDALLNEADEKVQMAADTLSDTRLQAKAAKDSATDAAAWATKARLNSEDVSVWVDEAETARDEAIAAKKKAQAARDEVVSAREEMIQIRNDLHQIEDDVLTARDTTVQSLQLAQTAQTQAQEAAAQAREAADQAREAAADWRPASANAIRRLEEGSLLRVNDISPLEHPCSVSVVAKNAIPTPFAETEKTEEGITYTPNEDGSITVHGVSESGYYNSFLLAQSICLPAGTYRFSSGASMQGLVIFQIYADAEQTYQTHSESPGEVPVEITLTQTSYVTVSIQVQSADHLTLRPEIVLMDLTGAAVMDGGKNRVPYPYSYTGTMTRNGVTFTDHGDGTITVNGTASDDIQYRVVATAAPLFLPPGTYTVSGGVTGLKATYAADGNYTNKVWINTENGPQTLTIAEGEAIINLYITVKSGATVTNKVFAPCIEAGPVATGYAPYVAPKACSVAEDGRVQIALTPDTDVTLYTEQAGLSLRCDYNRDLNKMMASLLQRLVVLEGK